MTQTTMTPQVRAWTEEEVLGIVLNHPELLPQFRAKARPADFHDHELRAIAEIFMAQPPPSGHVPTTDQLREALGPGLTATLTRIHAYSLDINFDVLLERLTAGRHE